MQRLFCFLVLLGIGESSAAESARLIPVVVDSSCGESEREAAQFLAGRLAKIYPNEQFRLEKSLPESGKAILVTRRDSADAKVRDTLKGKTAAPESYEIFTMRSPDREIGVIAGADARGTAYGVYALLEKLGCGFYLSYDAMPAPRKEPFSFDDWQSSDEPLVKERLVFNWHNFSSGCSTWNLADWQKWIAQSRKMGFNGIVVHAYGNNPMFCYEFGGKTKPVGYLSTTHCGRDWATQHVNDVRRLCGGSVFEGPVFGAEAAMVPDIERVQSAQNLMRQVFEDARRKEMDVYFAFDIDTDTSNPQELIGTLPPAARFRVGMKGENPKRYWLANPETEEGYRFYKTQAESLLKTYPQINRLALWVRIGKTPWIDMQLKDLPPSWQAEYKAEIAKTPAAAKYRQSHNFFALGKVLRAYQKALQELGRSDVQLTLGCWLFNFFPAAHRFLPPEVKLMALDYGVIREESQLRSEESRRQIRRVAAERPVQCIIWPQHDDGKYLGRSYTPFVDFQKKLADAGVNSYGVIHWTTRPLDLYFKSHAKQVWKATANQTLSQTCAEFGERSFGPHNRETMGKYLERWVTEAPLFGRETRQWFIYEPFTQIEHAVAGCQDRLKLLDRADKISATSEQRARIEYFQDLERYIVQLHVAQGGYQTSGELLKAGKVEDAREVLARCNPEEAIESYARAARHGGISRGEQGLLVTMNLRWLPHILQHRQVLGLAASRYNFAPTERDVLALAQARGTYTFHFDAVGNIWQTLGEGETKASIFVLPKSVALVRDPSIPAVYEEICRGGLQTEKPLSLMIRPIIADCVREREKSKVAVPDAALPAGGYRLELLFIDPTSTAAGERVAEYRIAGVAKPIKDRIDVFQAAGGARRIVVKSYPVELTRPGNVELSIIPLTGKAVLSGAVLIPENDRGL